MYFICKLKHAHTLAQVYSGVAGSGQVQVCVLIAAVYSPEGTADTPPTRFNKTARLTYTTWGSGNIESSIVAASSVTAV